jgi:hypothetical protein
LAGAFGISGVRVVSACPSGGDLRVICFGLWAAIEPGELKTDVRTTPFEDWLRSRDWRKVLDRGNVEMKSVEGK